MTSGWVSRSTRSDFTYNENVDFFSSNMSNDYDCQTFKILQEEYLILSRPCLTNIVLWRKSLIHWSCHFGWKPVERTEVRNFTVITLFRHTFHWNNYVIASFFPSDSKKKTNTSGKPFFSTTEQKHNLPPLNMFSTQLERKGRMSKNGWDSALSKSEQN